MTEAAAQIRAQAEDSARQMAKQHGVASLSPYLAGALEAKVDALVQELETANRRLANERAENQRLEAIEQAASTLLDEMEKAGRRRRHNHGPATTLEIEEAREELADKLDQEPESVA